MNVSERFLRYVRISTPSKEGEVGIPSTQCQFDMANALKEELISLSFENVRVTENCFVYGELPATQGLENAPCLGLVAHMDTAPAFNGMNVNPQIVENYDGGEVLLTGTGETLSPSRFPSLAKLRGKTLITTDGTSLLGADDKAGVAEIVTACEMLMESKRPHGKIVVGFTPDEETGEGVALFDVKGFGADFAYTVDGGELGEISYENFNACRAEVKFQGVSVHPGSAKDTMVNACLLAMAFNAMLPAAETPRHTDGREGFYHLDEMQGDVTSATLHYIVRDHDATRFEVRKAQMRHAAETMNHEWGQGSVTLTITDQYRNMKEMIDPCFFLIENARKAMRAAGFEPFDAPIRGGTDGARLCYMGLPCPNLCTGGHAFHGPYEHIAIEDMQACTNMLVELMVLSANQKL